jgi:hypothetical protein
MAACHFDCLPGWKLPKQAAKKRGLANLRRSSGYGDCCASHTMPFFYRLDMVQWTPRARLTAPLFYLRKEDSPGLSGLCREVQLFAGISKRSVGIETQLNEANVVNRGEPDSSHRTSGFVRLF